MDKNERMGKQEMKGLLLVRQDVVYGLLDGGDFFGVFVRDIALELFFKSHHQLNGIQRVGAQIIDKRRFILDFGFVHAQLLGDDLFYALFNRHYFSPTLIKIQKSSGIVSNLPKIPNNLSKQFVSVMDKLFQPAPWPEQPVFCKVE
jgi:hypothetical protein